MPRISAKKTSTSATKAQNRRFVLNGMGAYRVKQQKQQHRMKYPGVGTGLGAALGGAIGGPPGALIGGALGGAAHKVLNALTGFGEYKVRQNVLIEETNSPPQVINRGREFVVRHREYITDIYSASGTASTPSVFNNQVFSINPGDPNCFPWLSSIAGKFEQYRIEGMVFEYKSLYSDAVVTQNGSIGSIVLATEYNAGAPAFVSKQQMENYEFAQSSKPSCSVIHPIECARSQNVLSELYVRPSSLPAGQDIKTYDFGDFQIASQGIPLGTAGASVALGELWVSYQIVLMKPKIPLLGSSSYVDSGYSHYSTNILAAGTCTSAAPLGGTGLFFPSSGSNISGVTFTATSISIPLLSSAMNYKLDIMWNGATAANWNAPATGTIVNGTLISPTVFTGLYIIPNVGAAVASAGCWACLFISCPAQQGNNTTCTIPFQTNGTFPATGNQNVNVFLNAVPLAGL